MARPDVDPDAFIANLTPAQLDALNARQDARRAEIGAQPVFCGSCAGIGIEWHSGYGGSSDLSLCHICRGLGYVPRSQGRADAHEWNTVVALAMIVESVARNEYKMKLSQDGYAWNLKQPAFSGFKAYSARVNLVPGTVADFDLVLADGAHRITGSGELWRAIHYTCRGLAINYRG
jgi:hypothetical protein